MPDARVESGPARAVLSNPAHPYTRCLQLANPSMRADRRALYVMPEQMPSLRQLAGMSGCHFAPRCPARRGGMPAHRAAGPRDRSRPPRRLPPRGGNAEHRHDAAVGEPPANTSARHVLEVEGLQKHYAVSGGLLGPPRSVTAVKGASFGIAENEFVALVGESGSGKSTIAKLLAGLEQPRRRTHPAQRRGSDFAFGAKPRAPRRTLADGVSGSVFGAQSAAARREHRHPGDGSRQPPRQLGRTPGANQGTACGGRPIGRFRDATARTIVGRPAPAHQYRARALQHSQNSGCR